jgi:hypothetical protein
MALETSNLEEIKPQWRARLEDVLCDATRTKRRLLLITSTISLTVVFLGILPMRVEVLGIKFEVARTIDVLLLLASVNIYALIGFLLYAWADFHIQVRMQINASAGYINEFVQGKASTIESLNYYLRFAFDFIIPIIYGGYAIYKLYRLIA